MTTTLIITVVLTALAAVDVALTRVRLGGHGGEVAGRLSVPSGLLNTHTVVGTAALVVWVVFLGTGLAPVGVVGLVLWWVTVVAGLLILARWLPAHGRHSSGPVKDTWLDGGPGLSLLAHLGLLGGAVVFTTYWSMGWI